LKIFSDVTVNALGQMAVVMAVMSLDAYRSPKIMWLILYVMYIMSQLYGHVVLYRWW